MSKKRYSISDLSNMFEVTTRTIRFYEEKGLLQPERNGLARVYSDADKVKLRLILRGKRLGLSLEESRDLIEMYDPAQGNRRQLEKSIEKIREKRVALERQREELDVMLLDLEDAEEKFLAALAEVTPSGVSSG